MFDSPFETGSAVHVLSLLACVAGVIVYAMFALQYRGGQHKWLPRALAASCILAWIINTAMALSPKYFAWESSLPLYYCNWANLLGAAAALTRNRIVDALLYYWACGLTVWAFVTPTLEFGPGHVGFWIFWGYHLCIALAVCHLLVADRFRPGLKDWLTASTITVLYGIVLVPVNLHWGWNYAFLGQANPNAPTPIDFLGAWPLRLLWLALLAVAVFFLLTLPWLIWHSLQKQNER